jgi:hypothetical protein
VKAFAERKTSFFLKKKNVAIYNSYGTALQEKRQQESAHYLGPGVQHSSSFTHQPMHVSEDTWPCGCQRRWSPVTFRGEDKGDKAQWRVGGGGRRWYWPQMSNFKRVWEKHIENISLKEVITSVPSSMHDLSEGGSTCPRE